MDTWRSTLEVDDSATRKLSAVLRARLDSLQPSARLYIKVASVLSHPLSSGASDDRESKEEVNENLIAKHDVLSSSEGIGSSFSARDLLNIIVNSKLDASLLEMSSSQVKSYVRETLNVLVQKQSSFVIKQFMMKSCQGMKNHISASHLKETNE